MANYYSDPTASAAIGAVDAEMRRMRKKARQLQSLRRSGRLTPEAEAAARRQFTGIYRRVLLDALEGRKV